MARNRAKSLAKSAAQREVDLTDAAGEYAHTLPVRVLSRFAKLGDQPELRLISAGVTGAGLVTGNERLRRAGVRMLLAHELATLAKNLIKDRIDRTRPRSADDAEEAMPERGSRRDKEHSSFPSGHSAGAIAVAQAFAREFPSFRVPALAAAGTVALGQVPKNAHYPSDVAAGALLGTAVEALVAAAWPVQASTSDA